MGDLFDLFETLINVGDMLDRGDLKGCITFILVTIIALVVMLFASQ